MKKLLTTLILFGSMAMGLQATNSLESCEKCDEVYYIVMRQQYELCDELYYEENPDTINIINAKLSVLYGIRNIMEK